MFLPRLDPEPTAPFPPPDSAQRRPNGLLAWGGDLSPTRLMNAYRSGIFPWYSRGDPILWWSPDPRTVFDTRALHLSRRYRRSLRQSRWTICVDRDFAGVVDACAHVPRPGQDGTWILPEVASAYLRLHQLGHAHSVEVYAGERLIGGIYGVDAGVVFCGESMFGHESGASRLALAALCRLLADRSVRWLDAQMPAPHLASLGAQQMRRDVYLTHLAKPAPAPPSCGEWTSRCPRWSAVDFG